MLAAGCIGWVVGGSLREYMVHFRYEWLNYYERMSKDVVWDPHERFSLGFSRWRHSSLDQWVDC